MKIIDLRSDTITLPTDEMRKAMAEAEVGDDVYGEDPTINALEQLGAQMLNKEAALFTVSGTMSNLLASLTHTKRGDEVILGSESHIYWYEVGGAAAIGGLMMHTIPNDASGQLNLELIEVAIRSNEIHYPTTSLVCLENTHNRCGGTVLTPDYTSKVVKLAHSHGLKLHVDGARLFNAAVALKIPARELVKDVDSVSVCLSKGLSAPVGSLLCGTRDFVVRARKWRKMLGGGMRQAGVLAAAGTVALNTMINRLEEDHKNAKRLAAGFSQMPEIKLLTKEPQTNILIFSVSPNIPGEAFKQKMNSLGVKLSYQGNQRFRAVTNRMVTGEDIDEALERINLGIKQA